MSECAASAVPFPSLTEMVYTATYLAIAKERVIMAKDKDKKSDKSDKKKGKKKDKKK